jgi:uncharacterized membrane protein YkvA (DUF1232 family)
MARQQQAPDPDLLRRLWNNLILSWRLMFDARVSGMSKLIPVAMVLYIFSPIDLIPDLLVPFGVVDDVGILLLGLQLFIRSAPPGVVAEYQRRSRRQIKRGQPDADEDDAPQIIEGTYEVRDRDH